VKRWQIKIVFNDGTTHQEEWTGELSTYLDERGFTGIANFTATQL